MQYKVERYFHITLMDDEFEYEEDDEFTVFMKAERITDQIGKYSISYDKGESAPKYIGVFNGKLWFIDPERHCGTVMDYPPDIDILKSELEEIENYEEDELPVHVKAIQLMFTEVLRVNPIDDSFPFGFPY